jgi:two-component system, NtrC family, response regulator AtoC
MPKDKILIVDDDPAIRWTLAHALRGNGYDPIEAGTAAAALTLFDAEQPALTLLDINLPDQSGLSVLQKLKDRNSEAMVIMITTDVHVENTIAALRGRAYDFLGKPINLDELEVRIANALEASQLRKEVNLIRKEREREFDFDQIIGRSQARSEMIALARKVAESEVSTVLLQGESGTGKDLLAKAIHYGSRRARAPFAPINCAAIPAALLESEFFGYEKGAFTDAKARKEGLLEQAEGGTVFLDEIGEMELSLQAKLLRVLEEGSFRRVGGLKDIPLDVRVVAASNRNLKVDSEDGRFRLDLYYRLAIIQIEIPPLRERGDDVLILAEHFIERFKEQMRKRTGGLNDEVAEIFRNYRWPGNVRELRNVIERVMILEDGDMITTAYLPRDLISDAKATGLRESGTNHPQPQTDDSADHPLPQVNVAASAPLVSLPAAGIPLDEVETSLVRQAMERSGGNQTRAADLLHLSRGQLRYRLKKLEEAKSNH